jgi:acyl carrier protein
MPLTHNGKIDSKQLRKLTKTEKQTTHPTNSDTIDSGFREFADIVRNSLGIERDMIPDDNFFMCGGTSLKAMKLSAEIKKHYGKSINLRTFFMIPVIGDLYKAVLGTAEKKMAISDEDKLAKKLPLTYLQQFIFLSELMNQTVEKFILTAYTDYDEIFNQKAFRKSCMLVWEKHKSLHYEFQIDRSGEPYQIFSKEKCNYREIIAVKSCDDFDSEVAELSKWHPNILNGQNGRIVLLENKMKNISRIVITLHHAVSDERTFSIMFAEIEDVYHKICRENQIRKLAYDNAFAAYTLEKNRKQYAEISVDYLPKTVKMPGANTDANDGEMIIFEKSLSSMQALSAYCSAKGTTEFVGLLTAAIISFSLLTENDENGFVIPLSERYDYDMPDAVGVFIDEYLLHFRLAKEQTFGEVLSEVDKAYIRMISNGADSYREALKKKGLLDDFYKNRTYYPYFSYFESTSEKGRDMDFYEKQNDSETELMFVIKKSKDQYTLMLSYKNSFCKKEEAEKLVQLFGCVLDRMIDTPDCCVATCFDAQDNDVAQTDDTIEQVKAAWEEVLNQKCDDCDLNFFDAGGYSFLLYQLSAAVNRHTGRKIPFIALMTYPTIHSLAAYIEEDDDD